MSTQKNLITLCFAAVFTLGLAACGGGGGGDAPVTGTTDTDPAPDPAQDPVELAETAYGEYLDALTAYEVARGVYALTPTAANLTALREAVDKVETETSEALVLAGDGTAAQLVRAQNAVDATVTDSNDVAVIEAAVMAAADLVTALAGAATAATTYDSAKEAYEATEGMTQANLDALSDAATAAKATADAALVRAAGGSAAQLSEAQEAVAAADMADTHASGITTALEDGIANALIAYNTAKTAHTAAKTAHDDDASLDNANALKTAADTLLAAAMDAEEKGALGATAEQKMALASVSVPNAETYVKAAGTAVTTAQTAADAADVVVATKAAGTKVTAIGTEAGETDADDAGLGGSLPTNVEVSTYSMIISRDRDGTTVKIADEANAMDDDPKFIDQDAGLDGGRTMHVRTMEPNNDGEVVEEVVIVATDIDEPTATLFAKVAGQGLTVDEDGKMATGEDAVAFDPGDALNSGQSNDEAAAIDAAILANIMASDFAAAGVGTTVLRTFYAAVDGDGPDDVDESKDAAEVAGTYNGAMGTYTCSGTTCTVMVNDKGMLTAASDGWIFTPAKGATSDVADANYLHYGFWLKKTTKDGETTYNEVETFAEATGHPETGDSETGGDNDLAGVKGSATYEGGSVGVYVKNVLDDQADIVSATSGHFSADVELTATFGGDGVIANDKFTIGGTITGFDLSGGEVNDWAVGLGLTDFSGGRMDGGVPGEPGESKPGNRHMNVFDGVAIGDSTALPGKWNGVFYGDSMAVVDMDPDTEPFHPQPVAVIGEFNANFTDGTAAGGFGANIKK